MHYAIISKLMEHKSLIFCLFKRKIIFILLYISFIKISMNTNVKVVVLLKCTYLSNDKVILHVVNSNQFEINFSDQGVLFFFVS